LSQRPDLVAKLANVHAKEYEIRKVCAEYYPKVMLDAHVSETELDVSIGGSGYFGDHRSTYGALVMASIPIFDGFARRHKMAIAESALHEAENELSGARDAAAGSGRNVIIPRYNCRAATLANRLSTLEQGTPMSWLIQTLRHYPEIAIFLNAAKATSLSSATPLPTPSATPAHIWGVLIVFREMSAYRSLRKKEKQLRKRLYELASSNAATPCSSSGV